MTPEEAPRPTQHRADVDLSPFEGVKVLGESLEVLFSAMLRLRFGPERDGLMEMTATWPEHEADALERAMARSESEILGDQRTEDQRNADRFMAVAERVFEVSEAIFTGRGQGAA